MKDLSQTEMGTAAQTKSLFVFFGNFIRRLLPTKTHESNDERLTIRYIVPFFVFLEPRAEIKEISIRYKPPDIKALSVKTGYVKGKRYV